METKKLETKKLRQKKMGKCTCNEIEEAGKEWLELDCYNKR